MGKWTIDPMPSGNLPVAQEGGDGERAGALRERGAAGDLRLRLSRGEVRKWTIDLMSGRNLGG